MAPFHVLSCSCQALGFVPSGPYTPGPSSGALQKKLFRLFLSTDGMGPIRRLFLGYHGILWVSMENSPLFFSTALSTGWFGGGEDNPKVA
jgi:hypothetical protein